MELIPLDVNTAHYAAYRESFIEAQGGAGKAMQPIPLEDFMDAAMGWLKDKGMKEMAVEPAGMCISVWRDVFDPSFKKMHVDD